MWIVAGLPTLTALAALLCALWRPARRFVWLVLLLAVVNLLLAPLTSGEWFYQRMEIPDYQQAVASGNFTTFRELVGHHDPNLQTKMMAIAAGLLLSLAGLAAVQYLKTRGKAVPVPISGGAVAVVVLVAAATLFEVYHFGTRVLPELT